eukprot:15198.XXX_1443674_1443796_1 [CDS] Oithona nana genome sequencing.
MKLHLAKKTRLSFLLISARVMKQFVPELNINHKKSVKSPS